MKHHHLHRMSRIWLLLLTLTFLLTPLSISAAEGDQVQRAFIAYYARPADPAGLDYWADRLTQSNGQLEEIINDFGNSDEYTSRFSGLSNEELVRNLYQNLFNRDPDQAGLNFYVDWLTTGQSSLAEIALNILDGALNEDAQIIANKLDVADFYTNQLDTQSASYDLRHIAALLATVSATEESNTAARQNITQLIEHPQGACTNTDDQNLQCVSTASELEAQIKAMMLERYGQINHFPIPVFAVEDVAESADAGATARSTTNTQEASVDEADRIKTNGEYLFVAGQNASDLHIFQANNTNAPLVKTHSLATSDNLQLSGLYLPDSDQTQLLALAGQQYDVYPLADMWFVPSFWSQRQTELFQLNISDPANPQSNYKLTLDGEVISSRLIGSTLYVATRHTPHIDGLVEYPGTEAEAQNNRNLIEQAELDDLLPGYQLDGQDQGNLVAANDCLINKQPSNDQTSIISLLAIDITSNQATHRGRCYLGNAETLYASVNAIYLATTQNTYTTNPDGSSFYSGETNTEIHKFALNGTEISYRGTGSVNGHLGWQQDLKPFRMSEHNDVLRIITFTGDQPSTLASPARLYTLQENSATQALDTISELPNNNRPAALGKPGEQIYGVRFAGERGYLVTFRVTDPLYVLDLSDPTDPSILAELEINGYSDYLHPVGENYLLGIGKDAIPDTATGGDGRGAWYQGVKVSMIDVSDPQSPVETQQIIIGKRGSNTAVSTTHHALTTLQQGNNLQLAFPVSLHDTPNSYSQDLSNPSYFYDWTHNALQRYEINTDSGQINTLNPIVSAVNNGSNSFSGDWSNERSVMIGDTVYYLHGDSITARTW